MNTSANPHLNGPPANDASAHVWLDRAEKYFNWLSLVVISVVAAISAWTAGPVWRDEIHSLYVAHRPLSTIGNWQFMDTAPVVHYLVFRLGTMLFPGGEIIAARLTGLTICLGCVLAFIGASRALGKSGPYLVALPLFLQAFFSRYIMTVRTYGVSTLFGLLFIWTLWTYFVRGGRKNLALASLTGLLFLHSNYINSAYYALIASTFVVFCLLGRRWKPAILLALAATCSLATMLVYRPGLLYFRHAESYLFNDAPFGGYLSMTNRFLIGGFGLIYPIGLVMVVLALCWCIKSRPGDKKVWLAGTLALGCPVLHQLILWKSGTIYSIWYLIVPATLTALGAEVVLDQAVRHNIKSVWWRTGRLIVATLILLVVFNFNYRAMSERQTNMDAVAAYIEKEGRPGDYIVIVPFYLANSFHYYYHGAIPWQSVPQLPDYSTQRFDLLLPYVQNLQGGGQTSPVIEHAVDALSKGGRVWVVGQPVFDVPPDQFHAYRVAPETTLGEKYALLSHLSRLQAGELMVSHGSRYFGVPLLSGTEVNKWENVGLFRVDP